MDDPLLTWHQALQFLALGPCLFMLFFLCVAAKSAHQALVPCLYFLSLIANFCLPLLDIFPSGHALAGSLLILQSLTPALSFLLIMQFLTGHLPGLLYWTVLAVPLIGGSSLVYATLLTPNEVCVYQDYCTVPRTFQLLYEIFSASLTFLLTIVILHRRLRQQPDPESERNRHKRALVSALILLNLAVLGVDLADVSGRIAPEQAMLAATVLRIGFIYLVLTSVFRVFDRTFEIAYERIPHLKPEANPRDRALAARLQSLLDDDHIYRDMELSRETLSTRLGVSEQLLSRAVNSCMEQNLSGLLNRYRVQEAKARLASEATSVTVIAFEVGFSSIPSFNRVFKQKTGMSPTEYRQKAAPSA